MNQIATFAGGCFWCTEAVFNRLKGVAQVIPGYTGGNIANPTYQDVCSGQTGHAEAIQITFDPTVISYKELLDVFWHLHNPTELNRQGNDTGTQYRSAIFYHNDEQKKTAEESKGALEKSGIYKEPIVTEIVPAGTFYPAEDYHREYYEKNKLLNPYCQFIIDPKIKKLYKEFSNQVKTA